MGAFCLSDRMPAYLAGDALYLYVFLEERPQQSVP
jgi:hypothetical protein